MEDFQLVLSDFKASKGLTYNEMSEMFSVSLGTVVNWISGKSKPGKRTQVRILNLINMPAEQEKEVKYELSKTQ